MTRAISHAHAGELNQKPYDSVILAHDERRLRRKLLTLKGGDQILVDFPAAVTLEDGDALVLEDGRLVGIEAAREALYEITGRDREHIAKLCWHLGNRHLPAEIHEDRIRIRRDHVIKDMLIGLGATVEETVAAFSPENGAYHEHAHGHHHHHGAHG